MSAGIYNFTLNQGATFNKQMTVKENNSPLNLTGYTAAMQLRSATATATAALEEGIYVYDLEITTSAGVVTRLLQGQVTVSPEVTR